MTQPNRVERDRKPGKCPSCGHAPMASILYGLPRFNEELSQKIEAGRVTLGGCMVSEDDPIWECTHCGLKVFWTGRGSDSGW
ncbi:MAG: hypothetical protein ACPG4N_09420 [Gammaproteobacteria bacterium]